MLFVLGLSIVVGSVIGGYLGGGGHLVVLFQPFEFVIIFGAAAGAFVISNPLPVVIATAKSFGTLVKGSKLNKASYVELLSLLRDVQAGEDQAPATWRSSNTASTAATISLP